METTESSVMDYVKKPDLESDSAALAPAATSDKYNNAAFEKYCFFIGFVLPPVWFIGSSDCCRDVGGQEVLAWKKRCRIAATLVLTVVIVTAAVFMIVNPSMFGLRSGNSSSTQTSSSTDRAIRPGVPVNGTNSWGDTVAGVQPY
ncbi:hypothetical protein BJV82DRAFT_671753 [Fennellomyces sp. T-0311]|nr:hypothetical protein BJV82DRAFT_671753 [Fennellomyces sp. T-0311]